MASMTLARVEEKIETSANFKQALNEPTKKLQKKPKDPYLLYWKAAVHLKFGREDEAFNQLEELCASSPPITDTELLCAIYERLSQRESTEKSRQLLWDSAYKATKSGHLLTAWFESAAMVNCWSDAQIALTKLKAYFPKEEKYIFTLPAIEQLVADSHRTHDEKKQDLFSRLAYMKLAMAVKKAMKGEKATDSITTSRELRLLMQIYRKQNRGNELLEILDNPSVGLFSPLIRCDQSFVRINLEILADLRMWRELFDFCAKALKGEHEVDERWKHYYLLWSSDFALWRSLYLAYGELRAQDLDQDKLSSVDQTLEALEQQHQDKFARERFMAKLTSSMNSSELEQVLDKCNSYFKELSFRNSCFGDLRIFVEKLSGPQQAQFLDTCKKVVEEKSKIMDKSTDPVPFFSDTHPDPKVWLQTRVNYWKFEYLLGISTPERASKERLEAFAIECIRCYSYIYNFDDQATEDTIVLAIMALIRLYHLESSQQYLIQAALLFRLWDNRCGRELGRKTGLMRVLLMSFMGFFSESLTIAEGLRLKEILLETLAHHLYTRVSTTHPFPCLNGKTARDPQKNLQSILHMNQKNQAKLNQFLGVDLETLQYDRILEIAELKRNLSRSLPVRLWVIERRRISRIKGEFVDDEGAQFLDGELDDLYESRDAERLESFEHSDCPIFEQYLTTGPLPKRYWLAAFTLVDDTANMIASTENKRLPVANAERIVGEASESDCSELTSAETSAVTGWLKLRAVTMMALRGEGLEGLSAAMEQLEAQLESMKADFQSANVTQRSSHIPLASHIRHMYLMLEFLQGCSRFCASALKLSKSKTTKWTKNIPVKEIQRLQTSTQDLFGVVRQSALDWKNNLSEQGYQGIKSQAKSGAIGDIMLNHAAKDPDSVLDSTVSAILAGSNETLDGVLRVKLA